MKFMNQSRQANLTLRAQNSVIIEQSEEIILGKFRLTLLKTYEYKVDSMANPRNKFFVETKYHHRSLDVLKPWFIKECDELIAEHIKTQETPHQLVLTKQIKMLQDSVSVSLKRYCSLENEYDEKVSLTKQIFCELTHYLMLSLYCKQRFLNTGINGEYRDANGNCFYYNKGNLSSSRGPAVIFADNDKKYLFDDKRINGIEELAALAMSDSVSVNEVEYNKFLYYSAI